MVTNSINLKTYKKMSEFKPTITFREIKEFVNKLEDWQLDCDANVCGEERGFGIQEIRGLDEDYYVDDYAMQPVSVYDSTEDSEYPTPESQGYQILPKGTPYMYIDQ